MERSRIKKLGAILHFSDLGNAIIKDPQKLPKIGADVVTEELIYVGKVIDIFGPVKTPYISIKLKDEYKNAISAGTKLYAIEKSSYLDRRKTKKKKLTKSSPKRRGYRNKKKRTKRN